MDIGEAGLETEVVADRCVDVHVDDRVDCEWTDGEDGDDAL